MASVLGDGLDLRLFSYRDTTPLRSGQVDDDPYGGGAGMVLRVDVVAAALDAAYGEAPPHRIVALTPQGRPLTQELVEELAAETHLTLLSSRFEGFDERIVEHLATDAISIGPYVLSGGELPAMVLIDAIARQLPGALGSEESSQEESFSVALGRGLEYPHYTRPAEFTRVGRPRGARLRRPREDRDVAPRAEARPAATRSRSSTFGARARKARVPRGAPVAQPDRPAHARRGLPPAFWRIAIDWIVTIAFAVAIVFGIKARIVNPYRIPSSSMEPTLHCARPGAGCLAARSDRVLACRFCYHFRSPASEATSWSSTRRPRRRSAAARAKLAPVKRLIGLPGDHVSYDGRLHINMARRSPSRTRSRPAARAAIPACGSCPRASTS